MAISTTNLVPLDFETIKSNLKTYLSNQTIFKDVDFEASNINVLLDVLAYNTYHNSFYLNMVASEMFLDTAQLQNSITSHAKMLSYVPRSYRSAVAAVNITVEPENPASIESILIPKGASFTGRSGSRVFTFTTDKNIVVVNDNNTFVAPNVALFEGRYLSEVFTYTEGTRFVLSNPSVDTTSLSVVLTESGKTPEEYTRSTSFVNLDFNSTVYFLQPAENGQYEVVFGDGVFGKKPTPGTTIVVEYRISSGELPNTAAVFDSDGPLGGSSNVTVEVLSAASGGAVAETADEIRFRAPLTYATQQRAVTTNDYVTLIQNEFPDVKDVGVFGGEDLSPPRFGYVAIAMVGDNYDPITDARAQDVMEFVKTRCSSSITPLVVSPEFSYLKVATRVYYDPSVTVKAPSDIELAVLSAIRDYTDTNVNGFNKSLYYSKLVTAIDSSDVSVISNDTSVQLYRLLNPTPMTNFQATVDFGNPILNGTAITGTTHNIDDVTSITSTFFRYNGVRCIFEDDGNGKIIISTEVAGRYSVINSQAGNVDYATGKVNLYPGVISSYEGDGIRLQATLKNKDISAVKNTVLIARDADINITVSALRG